MGNFPSSGKAGCYPCRKKQPKSSPLDSIKSAGLAEEGQTVQAYGANAYELVGQLGSGRTGTMKLMKNKKTKEMVAAKFVERVAGAGLSKNTEREIVNHRRLLHPNIIRFFEVYMTDDHLVIVMEYASGGTLEERVKSSGVLTEDKAKDLFLQLLSGIEYCHSKSIYHRDLRLDNLHLHGPHFSPQLKITGFGYSKSALLDSQPKTNVGSPSYTPPELLMFTRNEGAAYDGGSNDIWSAGVILYYLLTGSMPFEDKTMPGALTRKMMQKIVNVEYSFPDNIQLSRECKDFISKIFVKDPKERPKIAEMRRHAWLSGASLPTESKVDESPQSELEIHQIVEKARRRRQGDRKREKHLESMDSLAATQSSLATTQSSRLPVANGTNGMHTIPSNAVEKGGGKVYELGIAEVPKAAS